MTDKDPDTLTNPAKRDGHPLIDDEVLEELQDVPHEEPFLTELGSGGGSEADPINQIAKWLPDEKSWKGKSQIHHEQARPIAIALHIQRIYPELADEQGTLVEMIRDYLEVSTSIDGFGREEHVEVLASQFSQRPEDGGGNTTIMYGENDDDDDGWF